MVRPRDYYYRVVAAYHRAVYNRLDVDRAADNVAAYIYDQFNYHPPADDDDATADVLA